MYLGPGLLKYININFEQYNTLATQSQNITLSHRNQCGALLLECRQFVDVRLPNSKGPQRAALKWPYI